MLKLSKKNQTFIFYFILFFIYNMLNNIFYSLWENLELLLMII